MSSQHNGGLSEEQFEAIVARVKHNNEVEKTLLDQRRERAQVVAKDIARAIGEADSQILRVWGFGSVFETWRKFRFDSDIDLALEGGNWFSAVRLTDHQDFQVSLIDLADVTPAFAASVKHQGIVLYEKS